MPTERDNGNPVREYRTIIQDSGDPGYVNRVLIGTPTTGLVRIEWVQARYGQNIPINWSQVEMLDFVNSFMPLRYQVADAQNIIVDKAVQDDFEWLLLIEHDVIMPPDAVFRLNRYITSEKWPVVSGLYFTRSVPSDPLVFRGNGTGYYDRWELGDVVRVDRVPTGILLIHMAILREMWNDAEEYQVKGQTVRRVFDSPRQSWADPEKGHYNNYSGTSDLDWSKRVIADRYLERAGWTAHQEMEYPFLIDTRIFCKHINPDGNQYPQAFVGGQLINVWQGMVKELMEGKGREYDVPEWDVVVSVPEM